MLPAGAPSPNKKPPMSPRNLWDLSFKKKPQGYGRRKFEARVRIRTSL